MKVATADQMSQVDQYLIEKEEYSINELVEIASRNLYEELNHYQHPFLMVGPGNNGADALSLAKHFLNDGKEVTLYLIYPNKANKTHQYFYEQIKDKVHLVHDLNIKHCDVLIDGVFGNGLDRPLYPEMIDILKEVNQMNIKRVAIDIPTGINATKGKLQEICFKADITISFMCYKMAFLNPNLKNDLGKIIIKKFGIEDKALKMTKVADTIERKYIIKTLKNKQHDDHKGKNGKITHFTGSHDFIGAACMASLASVYMGSGIVKVCSDPYVLDFIHYHNLAAVTQVLDLKQPDLTFNDAYLCGCGKGWHAETKQLVEYLITHVSQPLVLDADALNVLSENPDILLQKKGPIILTPHLVEFKRLCPKEDELYTAIQTFADDYDVILVVKGANTIVYGNHHFYRNTTGNPGMSIGGMGDVLAGIITALCGQGYEPLDAARLGVYIHGLAGDEIYKTNYNVIPEKLIYELPKVLRSLINEKNTIRNNQSV